MILPASVEDIQVIWAIVQRAVAGMQRRSIQQWDSVYPTRADFLADITHGHLYTLLLPELDGIAGLVALNQHQDAEYDQVPWQDSKKPMVVHRLTIDPLHQGKGLATAMMRFVEQHAREDHYSSIRLDAFTQNPAACHLYQKLDYSDRGIVHFRMGEFRCYEKVL
jgi:ribosomal protein S18 acetylase RimI-like enzyme